MQQSEKDGCPSCDPYQGLLSPYSKCLDEAKTRAAEGRPVRPEDAALLLLERAVIQDALRLESGAKIDLTGLPLAMFSARGCTVN